MQVRFNKLSTADPRNRSNKPWKLIKYVYENDDEH